MIFEIFQILSEDVNRYFRDVGLNDSEVILDNIAFVDGASEVAEAMRDKVVMTLVNFQEEAALKNFPNHSMQDTQAIYRNPIVNIHVFALFSANRTSYAHALRDVSTIMAFFQSKRLFTQANTLYDREISSMAAVGPFRFTVDLFSPSFEEVNFIWGTLGGRQLPSVLYKICLLPIQADKVSGTGPLIETVENTLKHR
ncbi:hypothetical protein ADIS_1410 [Lunatimonas lonarensis]|uniref:Pvc16 N-terminal domain-containing protein n=1 Tax=Lunatimonas lonarensis TaxID=1232681 RepID=R7ZW23_9BACT|nr:DUF4255 domain-containing protein [Lunatimonas lonarensis]EON78213.1 hypothetical protein ADIS_1410 [Lunatimonas lonarensis]